MKQTTRLLSWFLALVMAAGLLPAPALAALAPSYASGEEPLIFNYSTMSGAGPAQMDDWAAGEYLSVQERLTQEADGEIDTMATDWLKTRLMIRSMHFNVWDYEEPIGYFIPANNAGSNHELTLYGYEDVDPADITLTGVRLTGDIERHVYGDMDSEGNDMRLYWYTIPVFVPANDVDMEIYVSGELYATLPITHVGGSSPVALFTTLQVYDYEEGAAPDTLRSMTLRVSGFSLPSDPMGYTYRWIADPEAENEADQWASVDAAEVSEEDAFGYRLVTFEFNEDTPSKDWGRLLFDNAYYAYFFGAENHITDAGTAGAPEYVFRTDYDFSDENMPYGSTAEVPSPYYCIFKDPSETGETPEEMPQLTVTGSKLSDGAVSTQNPFVYVSQTPGSFLGGEWRLSTDGRNWHEWNAAEDSQNQTRLSFAESEQYGSYTICAQFRKEGLKTVTVKQKVNYNDGAAPAPETLGILDGKNAEVPRRNGSAVIKTGGSGSYCFYAIAPEGLALCYDFSGCDEDYRGTMTWNAGTKRYEATLAVDRIPREAVALQVWASGESEGYTRDGATSTLPLLFMEGGFLRPLYAPSVPYEVKKDDEGNPYYAVAPGARLSGMFEAAVGEGRAQRMTLAYKAVDGSAKSVSVSAAGDGNHQFQAVIPLPDDTDSLVSVRYELLQDGAVEESADYDLSAYKVFARSSLTGIPAAYAGAKVELKDSRGFTRSYFVTAGNCASIPLGDLPTGSYAYVITGASGHIAKGTVSVTRGADIALAGLPALGSVTVTTSGFTSSLTGREINPSARVDISLKAPDGTNCKLLGITGETFRQIPVGSTGTADVTVSSDSDEISACTAADNSFTVAGDETVAFAYQPFTFRTISGNVWGVKTYPSGVQSGYVPRPTSITVTQEITRGGKTETVTFSAVPDYSFDSRPRGKWSVTCYDNIPAKVEFRSFTWDTQTVNVTTSGNVNLGQTTMTYGGEMLIRLEAQIQTPASVKEDGTPYFSTGDSVTSKVDSGFLTGSQLWVSGHDSYSRYEGVFETEIINGQAYMRVHEGVIPPGEPIYVCAGGTATYGDESFTVPFLAKNGAYNYVPVRQDENGDPVAVFTATYTTLGGQFRAEVVDSDSEYVGFLAYPTGPNTCTFAYGRGELTLPYGRNEAGGSGTILAFMVPEKDAADMAQFLGSNPKKLWGLLPKDGGWSSYFFTQQYRGQLLHRTVNAYANSTVYLEDLQPKEPVLTGVLDPYGFTYRYELTDSPSTIRMVGTLSKRYPEQVNQDKIKEMTLYCAADREDYSELSATAAFNASDIGNGQTLITAELPLSYSLLAGFNLKLVYWHDSVTDDRGDTVLEFTHRDPVKIFSLTDPGTVYITDQLDKQGLTGKTPETQATWYLNLGLRAFLSTNPDENVITVYDNGTPIYSYDAGAGARNYWGLGTTDRLRVRLTDNLQAGIHVVWANRTLDGETISTEPVVFTLAEGRQNNSVYISELSWWHWNHRLSWDENEPDKLYFDNLSDLAGENIWIWPDKKHQMRFTVKNATSAELEGVNLVYHALWAQSNTAWNRDPEKYGYSRSISGSGYQGYNTVTRAIPCKLLGENKAGNYSIWGIDEFYMGYLQSFEFEFDYNAAIDADLAGMTQQELSDLETEVFYRANDLGDVPDDAEQIAAIEAMSAEERTAAIADMSEASQALGGLDLRITEDSATRMKMELKTPTDELSEYTVTMEKGGTMQLPDILMLMEKERTEGNQNPKEQGWDVTWAEFETLQGTTLMRIASYEGKDASGRHALLTHTTYYVTKSVADALESGGAALASLQSTASLAAVGEDVATPDHWTKQLYDGTSIVYSTSDLTDEAWKAYCKTTYLKANPGDLDGAAKFANGESLIPKKLDATMKVLGVADTVITYAKGPSGADPNGLRQLLNNVRDEKARRSLEMQIKDYETLRYDIYKQDCAMSTYSTASNFSPMGPIGKVVVFVGGLANGVISGWSKDYNRQVYNTTLHDIQMRIRYEAIKKEHLKKSFIDAEKWLRDKMDSIYGKGNWSEYALAQERKNWVLKEYPGGILRYVWKEKAPEFTVTQDPSGFVYEAVSEDTIEGVTAKLYYSETEDGSYSLWTDPYNEQPNPQSTSDTGKYMWMVPTGWWKVRYEKEGYRTSESIAMPVPPVHTTVNIGLLSEEAPKAAVSVGEGEITVLFTKYMQLESLLRLFGDERYTDESFDGSAFAVQFYDKNGVSVPGKVTFPDVRENTGYKGSDYGTDIIDSDWFVRYAVFTPDDPAIDLTGVTWRFAEGMVSYAGVALDGETSSLYMVRLVPNGGWLDRDAVVTDETGKISMLPEPSWEGNVFLGWFTVAEGGTRVTAGDTVDADCTLYGRWKTSYLTVTSHTDTAESHSVDCVVTPHGLDVTVFLASYSSAGRLLAVKACSVEKDVTSQTLTLTLPANPDDGYLKVFIVNSATCAPLGECQYYK